VPFCGAATGFPAEVAVVLTGLLSVLAPLADLARETSHLLLAPASLSAVAVTVLAGAMLAGALAACLASGARLGRLSTAVPLIRRAAALREKSRRAAFLPQRDPDAAGRPRPRAPSAAPAAAVS
jgi:Family of unknown function (DUF6412)